MESKQNNNPMEALVKQNKNELKKYLEDMSGIVKEAIVEDVELVRSDFEKYFLPMITMQVEPNEENMKRFINNILAVTESYFLGIKVIDDVTKEELFLLPPLMLDLDLNDPMMRNISFFKLLNMYKSIEENSGSEARAFLGKTLPALASQAFKPDPEKTKRYMEGLLKLYKFYGLLDEKGQPLENTQNGNREYEDNIGEFLDYDD